MAGDGNVIGMIATPLVAAGLGAALAIRREWREAQWYVVNHRFNEESKLKAAGLPVPNPPSRNEQLRENLHAFFHGNRFAD